MHFADNRGNGSGNFTFAPLGATTPQNNLIVLDSIDALTGAPGDVSSGFFLETTNKLSLYQSVNFAGNIPDALGHVFLSLLDQNGFVGVDMVKMTTNYMTVGYDRAVVGQARLDVTAEVSLLAMLLRI